MKTVIIIGAGASGMMAAITAKENGANVILLEHNAKIGKKILSTGNGRCNFTNITQAPTFYCSENAAFAWHIIEKFTAPDTLKFFGKLGVYAKNRNGYMYPHSEQATAILDALRWKIEQLQIQVVTDVTICKIMHSENMFQVQTKEESYHADHLILACGSKASQIAGSDGSGYALATSLGHSLVPVLPALVPLQCKEDFYKHVAGVRVEGKVSLYVEQELLIAEEGELQLTNYGISGIPVFQISRYAAIAIYEKKEVYATMDFMQHFSEEQLYHYLEQRSVVLAYRLAETFFIGLLPKKLGEVILDRCNIHKQKQIATLSKAELQVLANMLKNFKTVIIGTKAHEQAQVCRGGINTNEVHMETLKSKLVEGLYFAGEILDVDGLCGGYNLQWAWSSGYVAGIEAAK